MTALLAADEDDHFLSTCGQGVVNTALSMGMYAITLLLFELLK